MEIATLIFQAVSVTRFHKQKSVKIVTCASPVSRLEKKKLSVMIVSKIDSRYLR